MMKTKRDAEKASRFVCGGGIVWVECVFSGATRCVVIISGQHVISGAKH